MNILFFIFLLIITLVWFNIVRSSLLLASAMVLFLVSWSSTSISSDLRQHSDRTGGSCRVMQIR